MQITMNQADIELAISEFVGRKVRFENGVKPVIDLKATRGPEGFTATIDLTGQASASDDTPTVSKTVSSVERTPRTPKATGLNLSKPAAPTLETPAPETTQEAAQDATDEPTEDEQAVRDAESQDAAEGQEEAEDAPPAGEKPKSIFANLNRPRNN